MKNPGYDRSRASRRSPRSRTARSSWCAGDISRELGWGLHRSCQSQSGKLSYASAGVGNQTQLLAELFKSKAGIDVVHVPYRAAPRW